LEVIMGTVVDDFLTEMLAKQVAAETAIHNGDVEPGSRSGLARIR
jgi:hypothetical protein